jgi:hypothetical protein
MSRSRYLRPYASTTAWYSAWSADTLVHAWASSTPVAPPNDTVAPAGIVPFQFALLAVFEVPELVMLVSQ